MQAAPKTIVDIWKNCFLPNIHIVDLELNFAETELKLEMFQTGPCQNFLVRQLRA